MKILFLEDRPDRQKILLPSKEKDIEGIHALEGVSMPTSYDCKQIIADINREAYPFQDGLKLIIVHKSALETKGLVYINNYCKDKSVKLICFSGGINQTIYTNDKFEFLNINSADFYTEKLIPFLSKVVNNQSESLLELTTANWRISYLLLARQIIGSLLIENDEDAKFNFNERLENIASLLKLEFEHNEDGLDFLSKEIKKLLIL